MDAVYEYFPRSRGCAQREAGYLSGGERQMLGHRLGAGVRAASCCSSTSCRWVSRRSSCEELMARLRDDPRELGMTVLLVEQNARSRSTSPTTPT